MSYTIQEMRGPFGYSREGYGRVVYLFNSDIDTTAIQQVIDNCYLDFIEDDDGDQILDWSEYDPSCLNTKLAGEIEDEVPIHALSKRIEGDGSNIDKALMFFIKDILSNDIPIIFVDSVNKTISQLNFNNIEEIIRDQYNLLRLFVREYDHAEDY